MAVAGYFLIEGLSQFAGSGAAKRMLIVGGILFQITESICFIAASALTYHSLRWRYILFSLGVVLFSFSIGVMTLAQKTALQTGESQAQAIDEKRGHIREQIASLQQVIDSYRFNAEKQSRSIYKDSRALGQDSINRAAELEDRKVQLSDQLYSLNTARRQTSLDFFHRLEEVTGLPEKTTEFYFLVLRSLLLELSGIILLSFGANLRAYNNLVVSSGTQTDLETKRPLLKRMFTPQHAAKPVLNMSNTKSQNSALGTGQPSKKPQPTVAQKAKHSNPIQPTEAKPDPSKTIPTPMDTPDKEEKITYWEAPEYSNKQSNSSSVTGQQLNHLVTMVMDLYDQQLLKELDPIAIAKGLNRYCSQTVSQDTAGVLSKMINKRVDESC